MDSRELAVGQRWGYRARSVDRLVEVEILRIGTKRPHRILVHFVGDDQEGREEWVSPARLKVPWSEAAAWQARDDRWTALREANGPVRGTPEERAADLVFAELPEDWDLAELGWNADTGILKICDCAALGEAIGLAPTELGHPAAFRDGEWWLVPWPVTEVVVSRLACRVADKLLERLREDEATAAHEVRWGSVDSGHYFSPEICRQVEEDRAPSRTLVRRWCGAAAETRVDELIALRDEVRRLGLLAEEAISALDAAGATSEAQRLERELGVPIEAIRASREERTR